MKIMRIECDCCEMVIPDPTKTFTVFVGRGDIEYGPGGCDVVTLQDACSVACVMRLVDDSTVLIKRERSAVEAIAADHAHSVKAAT